MPSNTLLIELGTEELPPKSLGRLQHSLITGFTEGLKQAGLTHQGIKGYATPRRLALRITELIDQQPDQNIEKRGPAYKAAFDDAGEPTKALLGFMRGCSIEDPSLLGKVETEKGDYVVYSATKKGESLAELLPEMLERVLSKLPIDRRMRWGKSRAEFVRPVSWLVCLYGSEVLPLSLLGQTAGRQSRGHRFMGSPFNLESANDYVEACRNQFVIADFEERKALIKSQIEAIAIQESSILEMDEALLDEVTALVEWPVALSGGFDESFLQVPPEVLISAMKKHQRYFHLVDEKGSLEPRFITISNIESTDSGTVISGNERVIRPRLADAAFFYKQDTKTSLDDKATRLGQVVFQTELGTYLEKLERISGLAGYLAGELGADQEAAKRSGYLCKADLVSDMVGEFPDLQGIMGAYYARHDGESDDVVRAIEEHYRPTQSGSQLPSSIIGSCVSVADKLDTMVGLFGINQPPTGSRDPFALRRQSLGIIRICIENQLDISLSAAVRFAANQYNRGFETEGVNQYIVERLNHYYGEQGIPVDVVEAATQGRVSEVNLLQLDDVVKTLQAFKGRDTAESIVAANKRVANLLKKSDSVESNLVFDTSLANEPAELELYQAISDVDLSDLDSAGAKLEKLAVLQAPVDKFFDDVLVMADDIAVKNNRLVLLRQMRQLFLEVADFSLLQ